MSDKQLADVGEDVECSPECLLTSEPVIDPYFTDEEKDTISCRKAVYRTSRHQKKEEVENKESDLKKGDEKEKTKKVFLQTHVASSYCSGPELLYFLKFHYKGVDPKYVVPTATITELIEESFSFIFPEGAPAYFQHFSSTSKSWKNIASLIFEEFKQKDIIEWQICNHTLDYTTASRQDLNDLASELYAAFKKSKHDSNGAISRVATLVKEMHSVLAYLNEQEHQDLNSPEGSEPRDKSKKHDYAKSNFYNLVNIVELCCKVNSASKFVFLHPKGRRLPHDIGTVFSTKPDAMLVIPSRERTYPYLVVEVDGPYCEDVLQDLSSDTASTYHSHNSHNHSDSSEDEGPVSATTRKLESVAVEPSRSVKITPIENPKDYYEAEYKSTRKHFKKLIARESPIPNTSETTLAFRKSTGQLPLEMYGSLISQMSVKDDLKKLDETETSQAVGLFIMNEFIYLEKIVESNRIKKIFCEPHFESECPPFPLTGPGVFLAKWCFDLKIPNHRIAFQAFLYYLEMMANYEIGNFSLP